MTTETVLARMLPAVEGLLKRRWTIRTRTSERRHHAASFNFVLYPE